mmetsp:Transcript_24935/g.36605  ORF Transcript_24935/g.36605 Transcript_24935/m.36605 type:complete len:97 (+) Transcript_24935:44-334(+)
MKKKRSSATSSSALTSVGATMMSASNTNGNAANSSSSLSESRFKRRHSPSQKQLNGGNTLAIQRELEASKAEAEHEKSLRKLERTKGEQVGFCLIV